MENNGNLFYKFHTEKSEAELAELRFPQSLPTAKLRLPQKRSSGLLSSERNSLKPKNKSLWDFVLGAWEP